MLSGCRTTIELSSLVSSSTCSSQESSCSTSRSDSSFSDAIYAIWNKCVAGRFKINRSHDDKILTHHLFQSSGVYWLGAPEPAFQYSASQISASCHSHSMISPEILLTGLHLETFMGQSESDAARAHCCRRCNRC